MKAEDLKGKEMNNNREEKDRNPAL